MPGKDRKQLTDLLKILLDTSTQINNWVDDEVKFTDRVIDSIDLKLSASAQQIQHARSKLDPGKHGPISISLGKPDAISRFFAFNFVEKDKSSLQDLEDTRFFGSGVYAIYYAGDTIDSYGPISKTETPIYVGKALPKNPTAETAYDQGSVLWRRLKEHKKSLSRGGLSLADFQFRYAIIQTGMEVSVEDYMIRLFKPIWNKEMKICYGIGKHGDSAKTRRNKRSPWDTMHPGRKWAKATRKDQRTKEEIISKIASHFSEIRPIRNKKALYQSLSLTD